MLPTEDEFDPSALGEPERALRIWFDADAQQFEREERLVLAPPPPAPPSSVSANSVSANPVR